MAILPSESLRIVFAYDEGKFTPQQIEALCATNRHYLTQLVQHLTADLGRLPELAPEQVSELGSFDREPEA
ncbi:hypothetical protein [Vibrio sp. ED004]|uniref:hypothetical protein n=1 Tax=Vibrio sp. ED004 TaxID=2785124 RepID=UPI0020BF9E46|nr:hypothetical protein [Vibrio sp. ED004]